MHFECHKCQVRAGNINAFCMHHLIFICNSYSTYIHLHLQINYWPNGFSFSNIGTITSWLFKSAHVRQWLWLFFWGETRFWSLNSILQSKFGLDSIWDRNSIMGSKPDFMVKIRFWDQHSILGSKLVLSSIFGSILDFTVETLETRFWDQNLIWTQF